VPLDQLLQALEREATATADGLRAAAQAEALQLSLAAEAGLSQRREHSVEERMQALRWSLDEASGEAAHQTRGEVLRAREGLVQTVMTTLLAALPSVVERTDYREQLPLRLGEALASVTPDEAILVRCSPALVPPVTAALDGRSGAAVAADADIGSGFVMVARQDCLEVDDTLESRVARQRVALAREALKLLGVPA